MIKKTVIDQIEIRGNGEVRVRFDKQIVDDAGAVLASAWHRASVLPGDSIDDCMALVNAHLVSLSEASCDDYAMLTKHAKVAHTKAAIDARRARDAAAADALAAQLAAVTVAVENARK